MSTVTPQVVKYVIFLGWDGGYIREEYSGEGIIFPNGTILPPNHVKRECGNRIQINRYAGGLTVKTRLYFEIMDFLANNDLGVDIDVQLINHLNRVLELVKHHSIVANQAYTDIMINNFISKLFSTIITKYHSIEAFSQKSNKTRMALNSIIERFIDYESIYTNEEVKKYLRQNSSAKNKALLIKLGDVADLIEEYKQAGDVDALLHLLQQQKVSSEDKNNIISHYISLVNNGQPNGTASAQSNLLSSKILLPVIEHLSLNASNFTSQQLSPLTISIIQNLHRREYRTEHCYNYFAKYMPSDALFELLMMPNAMNDIARLKIGPLCKKTILGVIIENLEKLRSPVNTGSKQATNLNLYLLAANPLEIKEQAKRHEITQHLLSCYADSKVAPQTARCLEKWVDSIPQHLSKKTYVQSHPNYVLPLLFERDSGSFYDRDKQKLSPELGHLILHEHLDKVVRLIVKMSDGKELEVLRNNCKAIYKDYKELSLQFIRSVIEKKPELGPMLFDYYTQANDDTLHDWEKDFLSRNLSLMLGNYGYGCMSAKASKVLTEVILSKKPLEVDELTAFIKCTSWLNYDETLSLAITQSIKHNKIEFTENNIDEYFKYAVKNSNIHLLHYLLKTGVNSASQPLREKIAGKLSDIFNYDERFPPSREVLGLIYAFQQKKLPNIDNLEPFLKTYCLYCYKYWQDHKPIQREELRFDVDYENNESSMAAAGNFRLINPEGKKRFPNAVPADLYQGLIKHIGNRLQELEGHNKAAKEAKHRKKFLPNQVGPVKKDKDGRDMSEKDLEIARLHTALRLLLNDRCTVPYDNPISDYHGGEIKQAIGYLYAMAQENSSEDALVSTLADIRRSWNNHPNYPKRANLEEDYVSCSDGTKGYLTQYFSLNSNLVKESDDNEELKAFAHDYHSETVIDMLCDGMKKMLNNCLEGNSAEHLAWLILHYKKSIYFEDDYLDKANSAVEHIVEHEFDFKKLFSSVSREYQIESTTISERSLSMLKLHIKTILAKTCKVEEGYADIDERTARLIETTLFKNILPTLLMRYISKKKSNQEMNYKLLSELYAAFPEELKKGLYDSMQQELSHMLQFHSSQNDSTSITELFKRIDELRNQEKDDGDYEFKLFSANQFMEELFTDVVSKLGAMEQFNQKLQTLIEAVKNDDKLKYYNPVIQEKLVAAFRNNLNTKLISQKKQLKDYALGLKNAELIDDSLLMEVFYDQAKILFTQHRHTELQELQGLALSLNVKFEFPMQARDDTYANIDKVMSNIEGIGGMLGFKSNTAKPPKPEQCRQFDELKTYSRSGSAKASLAIAKLYDKKCGIDGESKQWVKNIEMAKLYGLLAIFQAQTLGDNQLANEARTWFKQKGSLEAYYHETLNQALTKEGLTQQDPLINLLIFIATSVNFTKLSKSEYDSEFKQRNLALLQQCRLGDSDASQLERLIIIYEALESHDCSIKSEGGSFRSTEDPSNVLEDLRFRKKYQNMEEAIKSLGNESMTCEQILQGMAQHLKQNSTLTLSHLQQVYSHLTGKNDYLGQINPEGDEREKMLFDMLGTLCRTTNSSIKITRQQAVVVSSAPASNSASVSANESAQQKSQDIVSILKAMCAGGPKRVSYDDFLLYCTNDLQLTPPQIVAKISQGYKDSLPCSSTGEYNQQQLFKATTMQPEEKFQLIADHYGYEVIMAQEQQQRMEGRFGIVA